MGSEPSVQPALVISYYRLTVLHYSYGCATLSEAYLRKVYLGNHCCTLHLWVSNQMSSLCPLALPTKLLRYTTLMGAHLKCSLFWLRLFTEKLGYTYGCPTLSAAYVSWFYLQNHWVALHLWVCNLKCSLFFLGRLAESLSYNTLMSASTLVEPILHYIYRSATLSAASLFKLYPQNDWVTLHL